MVGGTTSLIPGWPYFFPKGRSIEQLMLYLFIHSWICMKREKFSGNFRFLLEVVSKVKKQAKIKVSHFYTLTLQFGKITSFVWSQEQNVAFCMVLSDQSLKCHDHLIKSGKDHSCFRACFNTQGHEVSLMTAQNFFFFNDHQIKNLFSIGSFNTIHLNPTKPRTT